MRLPASGELNRRIGLYSVAETPVDGSDIDKALDLVCEVWSKFEVIGGQTYFEGLSLEEKVTHRIYVRYVPNWTRPEDLGLVTEVVCGDTHYRVKRVTNVNMANQFTMLEVEALGDV